MTVAMLGWLDGVTTALLGVGCGFFLLASIGVLSMRGTYDRLHYATLGLLGGVPPIALALILAYGLSSTSAQVAIASILLVGIGPILNHATARAERVRKHGDLPLPGGHRRP